MSGGLRRSAESSGRGGTPIASACAAVFCLSTHLEAVVTGSGSSGAETSLFAAVGEESIVETGKL